MSVVAEDLVVRIRAEMADLDAKMARAATVTTNTTRTIEKSSAAAANASRNMGRQIADVGAQLASGQSPFLILAQQAPQMADALADSGGKAAKVAAFFAGPWGAAILAAASVVGVLIGKMYEAGEAADKTKPKIDNLTNAYANLAANLGKIDPAGADALARAGIKLATDRRDLAKATDALSAAEARLAASQRVDPKGRGSAPAQRDVAEAKARVKALQDEIQTGQNLVSLGESRFKQSQALAAAETKADKATRGRASSSSAAADSTDRQKKAQGELVALLERVAGKYDPVRAAAIETGKALADIDRLEMNGIISAADALAYKLQLARDQAVAVADAMWKLQEQRWLDVGFDKGDFDGSNITKSINDALEQRQKAADDEEAALMASNERVAQDFQDRQQAQIYYLANLYEDLFQGGNGNIWRNFKQMGFRAVAEVLARLTVSNSGSSGGGFNFDSIAAAIGGLFKKSGGGETGTGVGFSAGGYTGDGPRNEVAGVVHRGEYVIPADVVSKVGVGNLQALGSASAPIRGAISALPKSIPARTETQVVTVVVQEGDLFQAKVAGISKAVSTPIARAYSTQAAAGMGQAVLKAVPQRIAQYSRDGI
jgi:hypothetical protein